MQNVAGIVQDLVLDIFDSFIEIARMQKDVVCDEIKRTLIKISVFVYILEHIGIIADRSVRVVLFLDAKSSDHSGISSNRQV